MAVSKKIAATYSLRAGSFSINRGTLKGEINLYSWDYIDACDPERCPLKNICKYGSDIKCTVMGQYMKSVSEVIINNFYESLDEPVLYRMGIHLMPLYRQLFKMKFSEIMIKQAMELNDKSGWKVNPVYREIREIIKTIEWMWNRLGLTKLAKDEAVLPPSEDVDSFFTTGNYYDQMEKEVMKEMEVSEPKKESEVKKKKRYKSIRRKK